MSAPTISVPATDGVAGRSEWVRQALASCYVHSPLPGMLRRLRDRYGFRPSRPRKRLPLGLKKREYASARILYFHRVNDDNDPFFPATSTSLFEAEMRFVRAHHRVVSLGELLARLAEGPAEPVLAITFDDGYQDNYLNAFPILRSYGLPATIFLTTGSMDTGEPLWFERVALALKRTNRNSIDLEDAKPVRLSLQTEADRLRVCDEIFSILRRLPDWKRREMIADLLRQLDATDDRERRRKMLNWNEARAMAKQGIVFGGHTVNHPFLSRLGAPEFQWEISECKRRIENELQRSADFFAYPNGREEDFGLANKELVREAGYRAALTTIWGVNYSSTDRFELRRGGPWEPNPAVFACKLDWYELSET